jgi:hypothetical protein
MIAAATGSCVIGPDDHRQAKRVCRTDLSQLSRAAVAERCRPVEAVARGAGDASRAGDQG